MIRWKMDLLAQRYCEATGKELTAMDLIREAGVSTTTAYLAIEGNPKRIGFGSLDGLLSFFNRYLDDIQTSDLIEFEDSNQP